MTMYGAVITFMISESLTFSQSIQHSMLLFHHGSARSGVFLRDKILILARDSKFTFFCIIPCLKGADFAFPYKIGVTE